MSGLAEFIPNPGFITELRTGPAMLALLTAKAEAAKVVAEQIAPVGNAADYHSSKRHPTPKTPGSYRKSMHARGGVVDYPGIGPTAIGRLYNTNFKAHWIEDGTARQAPNPVLHRAVEAAGLASGLLAQ